MNSAPSITGNPWWLQWEYITGIIIIGAIIFVAVYTITIQSRVLPSTSNITRITEEQSRIFEQRYSGYPMTRKGLEDVWSGVRDPKDGKTTGENTMLINTNVFATRLTGALGPFDNGVFSEDISVRYALQTGSRFLVLEIDHPVNTWKPILTIRDNAGYVRSLNSGSLRRVAESIAGRAFTMANDSVPPAVAQDPLLVFLYFRDVPSPIKQKDLYIQYLQTVAEELSPLRRILLGNTPSGSYRRQAKERDIWFQPHTEFRNKCILLCNIDTSIFREERTTAIRDLDEMVNARVYTMLEGSNHGATTGPKEGIKPAVVLTNPDYWLNIPENKFGDAIVKTKEMFVICMTHHTETKKYTKKNIEELYNTYGVHAVPYIPFDEESYTKIWLTSEKKEESLYRNNSWNIKSKMLRFIPPPPVVSLKQNPRLDTDMGKGAGVIVLK